MRGGRIEVWRCQRGCRTLFAGPYVCPTCGSSTVNTLLGNEGVLLVETTVRVSPDRSPYRIGIAATRAGNTLCIVEGRIRGCGYDRVRLEIRRGCFYAIGK